MLHIQNVGFCSNKVTRAARNMPTCQNEWQRWRRRMKLFGSSIEIKLREARKSNMPYRNEWRRV